jgi:hypothetical protein
LALRYTWSKNPVSERPEVSSAVWKNCSGVGWANWYLAKKVERTRCTVGHPSQRSMALPVVG